MRQRPARRLGGAFRALVLATALVGCTSDLLLAVDPDAAPQPCTGSDCGGAPAACTSAQIAACTSGSLDSSCACVEDCVGAACEVPCPQPCEADESCVGGLCVEVEEVCPGPSGCAGGAGGGSTEDGGEETGDNT